MGQLAAGFENLNKILKFSENNKGDSILERKKMGNWNKNLLV